METYMKVRRVSLLADGRFAVDTIDMDEVTKASVLAHLGVVLKPVDTITKKDDLVIAEISTTRECTWNRFVFMPAVDLVA